MFSINFDVSRFRDLVITCLANCPCRPGSAQSACPADRADQLKIEVLIKLADINKALELNGCQGYQGKLLQYTLLFF